MYFDFSPGIEYRELSPRQGGGKWRFLLQRAITVKLHFSHPDVSFHDASGHEWARIEFDVLTIRSGYAWNGCSPKMGAGPLWLGTPDFHGTRKASLVHDVLFQFSPTAHFRATFGQCNEQFRRHMLRHDFPLAEVYFAAVQKFGRAYFRQPDPQVKSLLLITENP